MKQGIITSIILIFINANIICSTKKDTLNFQYPLNITPLVSGSFGELRNNHFHTGLDISTNRIQGIPVHASADGFVSRIRISPGGYGNALYIEHDNGYTTLYAHLQRFVDKIDKIAEQEQYSKKQFTIDYFPRQRIYVKKGEIIAYTGNSGSSGGPHLHYEIRETKDNITINPFKHQNKIIDNIAPKFLLLKVYPINDSSLVNGRHRAAIYNLILYNGKYHLNNKSKIYASGEIGLGVQTVDYVTGTRNKCGLYSLDMKVNNKPYYNITLDKLSFNEMKYINSYVDYEYYKTHKQRIQKCFKEPQNKLSTYKTLFNSGIITIDTTKIVKITAKDAALNSSELNLTIYKSKYNGKKLTDNSNELILCNKDTILYSKNAKCIIKKGNLYKNEKINFSVETDNLNRTIYTIGKNTIPIHNYITLIIRLPDSLKNKQPVFANKLKNGKSDYAGRGIVYNGNISNKLYEFGKYYLTFDSIAPSIISRQYIKNKVFTNNSVLKFTIKDNFSGIKSYNAYLNDKWVIAQYDSKNNLLSIPLKKAHIIRNNKYNLKIKVSDNCDNTKELNSWFFYK